MLLCTAGYEAVQILGNYSVTSRLRRFLVDNSESLIRQQNSKFSKDSSKNAHIMRANALALNERTFGRFCVVMLYFEGTSRNVM